METVQECLDWNDQTCLSTKEDRSIYKQNDGTGGEYEFTGTMLIMVLDGMQVCMYKSRRRPIKRPDG